MKAIINLFKAVPIEKKGVKKEASENLLKRTVSCGFVFAPEVVANYTEKELFKIADDVEKVVGISGRRANMTFHKSWAKVKNTPIEQLLFEQFLHYLTTYGFEAFGIDSDFVFIPTEKLEIPEIQKEIPLIVIKGYTKEELKEKIFQLLSTGIALKEETIHDVVDVALFVGFTSNDVEKVKNKEARIVLYSRLGLVPSNNIEFLRYIVYMTTGKTLIIKNDETINAIKQYNMFVINAFEKYKNEYGFEKLAEIFYRFKPIFLALRTNAEMNKNINRIRRLAKRYHRPMKVDYINNVTALVKKGQVDKKELEKELKKVNIYRKVRLANALKYRTIDTHSILYKIRNGKAYATPFNVDNQEKMKEILEIVLKSIASDIRPTVKNKKIYIPEYISYTFPTSEKNFVGNMPAGSSVVVPNNLIFGIHWENYQKKRIDLDLSLLDATTGEKIGWDGEYRTEEETILFSGDVTDAKPPDGASEVYYIDQKATKQYLIGLNFYNFYDLHLGEIPYKFFVGSKEVSELSHNYVVDPNSIILTFSSKIEIARIIGLLVATLEKNKIFFVDMKMSSARTFSNAKYNAWAQEYLFASSENTIDLRTILEMSGAQMVKKEECEIDLSPEVLEKDYNYKFDWTISFEGKGSSSFIQMVELIYFSPSSLMVSKVMFRKSKKILDTVNECFCEFDKIEDVPEKIFMSPSTWRRFKRDVRDAVFVISPREVHIFELVGFLWGCSIFVESIKENVILIQSEKGKVCERIVYQNNPFLEICNNLTSFFVYLKKRGGRR